MEAQRLARDDGPVPEIDDLIIPLRPAHAARRRSRSGEAFRGHDYSGKRWREEDLPALGWRHRQHYDMKATFITLVLEDGADENVIRDRMTRTKKTRSAFDGYNRGRQWAQTCAEVAKLQLTRLKRSRGAVVPIAKPSISEESGDALGTAFSTAGATPESYKGNVVEAAGVESG